MTGETWPPVSYKRLRYLMDHGQGQRAPGPCAIPDCRYIRRYGSYIRDWESPLSPVFVWDHCHLHDYVRGILCRYHNAQMSLIDRYCPWVIEHTDLDPMRDHWSRCPQCASNGPWRLLMRQLRPDEIGILREMTERRARHAARARVRAPPARPGRPAP